jgi:hypothetical protein
MQYWKLKQVFKLEKKVSGTERNKKSRSTEFYWIKKAEQIALNLFSSGIETETTKKKNYSMDGSVIKNLEKD